MCACNQSLGSLPCSKDVWNRKVIAGVSSSASSFKYLACMLSGPVALCGLMFLSNLYTPFSVIVMFCIAEYGDGPLCGMFVWSSCVYTDLNCAFSISALSFASLCRYPWLSLNGDIPDASCFFALDIAVELFIVVF